MKATIKIIAILSLLFILSACNDYDNDADRIELYILRNIKGTNNFVIDEEPIITGEDILSYEWDKHTIVFKDEFLKSRQIDKIEDDSMFGGSKILGVYYPNQFAIYIDGKELYRGYIEPPVFISFMPTGPMMSHSENGIIFNCFDKKLDTRNNEKLYKILKNNDLLR